MGKPYRALREILGKIRVKERINVRLDAFKTFATMGVVTIIGSLFYFLGFQQTNILTFYILGIVFVSFFTSKKRWGMLSCVMGILFYHWLFSPPRFGLAPDNVQSVITILAMMFVSILINSLTLRYREQEFQEKLKLERTEALLETSHRLQQARDMEGIISASAKQLKKLLGKDVILYAVEETVVPEPYAAEEWRRYVPMISREALEEWLFSGTGRLSFTVILDDVKIEFLRSALNGDYIAAAGVVTGNSEAIAPFERDLITAMLDETVLSMEKHRLNMVNKEIVMRVEKERVRADFLRAVSHDLRTPLTGIFGNAEILLTKEGSLDQNARHHLYEGIYNDAEWLIAMVENLLFVTRIENGGIVIHAQGELLQEVIAESLLHVNKRKSEHNITVEMPDDMLMARLDSRLITQVIINIVDNAVKYTELGSHIVIKAFARGDKAVVEIADDGEGLSDEEKARVFEMFYTVSKKELSVRGTGLGLYLCKSIVNSHGGEIYVRDNIPKGAVFGFTLPLERVGC